MKTINIHPNLHKQNPMEICLGNGYRKIFDSMRDAKKFTADTNRYITECLALLNNMYVEVFRLYRSLWFVASNNKTGTRTNYLTEQQRIKTMLHAAEDQFDKFNFAKSDPYFCFIDIKKACLFLSEALQHIEQLNRKRNLTADMYAAVILLKRCELVKQSLENYPN